MRHRDSLRWTVALFCVAVGAAVLLPARAPATGGPEVPAALNPEAERSAELDRELGDLQARVARKDAVADDWLDGRLGFAEAVARIRAVDANRPEILRFLEMLYPAADPDE